MAANKVAMNRMSSGSGFLMGDRWIGLDPPEQLKLNDGRGFGVHLIGHTLDLQKRKLPLAFDERREFR